MSPDYSHIVPPSAIPSADSTNLLLSPDTYVLPSTSPSGTYLLPSLIPDTVISPQHSHLCYLQKKYLKTQSLLPPHPQF